MPIIRTTISIPFIKQLEAQETTFFLMDLSLPLAK